MGRDKYEKARGNGERFLTLHYWMLTSAAWRSLGVYSRCLYLVLKQRYNGRNNGVIPLSYREAQDEIGCSNKPIPGAFRELEEKGFIKPQRKGAFKGIPSSTRWVLTELPQDEPERSLSPTKDFMKWQPSKKPPHAESVPTARRERAANDPPARPERVVSTPRAYREGQNDPVHSTPRAGSINIPDRVPAAEHSEALMRNLKRRGLA